MGDPIGGCASSATGAVTRAPATRGGNLGDGWVRWWGAVALVRTGALCARVAAAPKPWTGVLGFALFGAGLPVIVPEVFTADAERLPGAADTAVAKTPAVRHAK